MNKFFGRVVLRKSNVGIPNLLVTAYTANSSADTAGGSSVPNVDDESRWIRLGSVLTDEHGHFSLTREDGEERKPLQRFHLVLVVSVAEDLPFEEPRATLAICQRRGAANMESFRIAVDEARLVAAAVPVPRDPTDIEEIIEQRRIVAQRQARLDTEERRLFAESLEKRRKTEERAEPDFERVFEMFSAVPAEQRNLPVGRYVAPGRSVLNANQAIIRKGITGRIKEAERTGIAALKPDVAAQFKDSNGQFLTEIGAEEIEPYLLSTIGKAVSLSRVIPPSMLCKHELIDPCVEILKGREPDEQHEESPTDDSPPPTQATPPADIPLLIGKLVEHLTPPESATIFKVHTRAGIEDVQQRVDGFTLHSGPADVPSLHEFHHLQIAFEHVWQELFDQGATNIAKDIYAQLVEVGVDPNKYLVDLTKKTQKFDLFAYKKPAEDAAQTAKPGPPTVVISAFSLTPEQWGALHTTHQTELKTLAKDIAERLEELTTLTGKSFHLLGSDYKSSKVQPEYFLAGNEHWLTWKKEQVRILRRKGELIISYADQKLRGSQTFHHLHHLLGDLEKALKEPYRFSVYAANQFERSVNFGLMATYRQKWEPLNYQVGELVKTVPLAPKEVRRFTKKVAIRKSRAEKEVENNLQARKTESSETSRTETEIVQKALKKTNFQMAAEGGVNVGIANAKGSTSFSQDAATESNEVKKEFREAVFKAAEEYKSERTTEINVSTNEEFNLEESGEISNPNDEIPVTYLFYELQRRYRVSEAIHRVMPVILVAQEFPRPDEIDEDWIVANDWILRRVILDDSFIPAMNYLASKVVGDEVSLQEMYISLQQQRRVAEELKEELVTIRMLSESRYAAFQRSIEKRAEAVEEDEQEGIIPMPVGFLSGGSDSSAADAARVREDAARDAYERAMKQEKDVFGRLERETTALNTNTETYTKALSDHLNRKAQISRLRVHLKANIMYYMQAIWSHEPHDQRFFRLHEVRVPKLEGKMTYTLKTDPDAVPMPPDWIKPLKLIVKCELNTGFEFLPLVEVADLDNLLGFKGNYMIFPLKELNPLTKFMMTPYLDPVAGLGDPDPLGNWTLSDFIKYACCLHHELSKEEFEKLRPGLEETYRLLVNRRGGDGEEIIVPSDSLFMEALPGVHPILEDFKLFHRVVDVKKVQAEVRAAELENVRMAARLLAGEREDPTIEKKIVIDGTSPIVVNPDDN